MAARAAVGVAAGAAEGEGGAGAAFAVFAVGEIRGAVHAAEKAKPLGKRLHPR